MGSIQQPQQGPSSGDTIKQEDEITEIQDDATQSSTGAPGSAVCPLVSCKPVDCSFLLNWVHSRQPWTLEQECVFQLSFC